MPLNNDNAMEYWGNENPKCPKCDKDIDIDEWELYELYGEDSRVIECPYCEDKIYVVAHARYTFSTDEQPEA